MEILIAMDSFKGSLTAPQACAAVARGMAEIPSAHCTLVPMADGGEGTASCFAALSGEMVYEKVPDLFGREKNCEYALLDGGNTAVIEMAQSAGIADLMPGERDVLRASTYGVGCQIRNALLRGCKKIIIGLGGSATTDGGLGALQALGVDFYDKTKTLLPPGAGGKALSSVFRADKTNLVPLDGISILYACDVTNPYYGKNGAAFVYGPQKGADQDTVVLLDKGLQSFSEVLKTCFGADISTLPGAGAAGGLCGGLYAALGGEIRSGFDLLAAHAGLEEKIAKADLVITGEGKTDGQTAFGKLPCRVGETAKKYGVPVLILSGSISPSATELYDHGITALFDTVSVSAPLKELLKNAEENLFFTSSNVARLINGMMKK